MIGAGVGALLGSAIAGNSSNTEGTIIGGIAGAIAGNQIAKNTSQPCPPGYVLYDERGPVVAAPVAAPAPYDSRDYRDGRSDRDGRYAERDDWYDDRGGFDRNRFWAGAPSGIEERVAFLERRIRRGVENGAVTRREADRAYASLETVRREELRMRRRSGGRLNSSRSRLPATSPRRRQRRGPLGPQQRPAPLLVFRSF